MAMKSDRRSEYLARKGVLAFLSDDEIASVSSAEAAAQLAEGEEYLDLEQLHVGVQRVALEKGVAAPMGRLLPRKAIPERTWRRILTQLAAQ